MSRIERSNEKYNRAMVKEILRADQEPTVGTVWCLTCQDWLFADEPPCQNIDCPYQQLKETP